MTLDPSTKLGAFEITGLLGKGGMGEVYRARDTKLGRDVAIKVLSEQLAANLDMLARFEREALSLAKLDHPNIAAIYEVGKAVLEPKGRPLTPEEILYGFRTGPVQTAGATTIHFLVMQLVEGETLADRFARGPLSTDEADVIFGQIAEGLEAAHEQGIVHRDLKPANIKVDRHDRVKILDFGIAKSTEGHPAPGVPTPTPSSRIDPTAPTRPISTPSGPLTGEDVLIGTPQYMSPEQIRGKHVDRRTDIWAFGVCLYQALTGHLPFDGEVVADVLSAVLRDEVNWTRVPAGTPDHLRRLLERCLERDPKFRLRDIGEAWVLLNRPPDEGANASRASVRMPVVRFSIPFPEGCRLSRGLAPLAISRDGQLILATLVRGGERRLYMRRLDSTEFEAVEGTDRARNGQFSRDGKWIGFVQGDSIKAVPVEGGAARTIVRGESRPFGPIWGAGDWIYWGEVGTGVYRSPVGGGEREVLSTPDATRGEQWHAPNVPTPDDRWILACVVGGPENELAWFSTAPDGGRRSMGTGSGGYFVGTEYMVVAHRDEVRVGKIAGDPPRWVSDPVRVLEGLRIDGEQGTVPMFSVSESGTMIYAKAESAPRNNTLYWVNLDGERREIASSRQYMGPRISPDGELATIGCPDPSGEIVMHIYDLERGVLENIKCGSNVEMVPVWHPDGLRMTEAVLVDGSPQLHEFSINSRTQTPIGEPGLNEVPSSISSDGKYLAYVRWPSPAHSEIRVRDDSGHSESIVDSGGRNVCPRFDAQGHLIAYASNGTGSWEVFITPFGTEGRRIQVSMNGGVDPVWAPDGSVLYYRRGDAMMAVDVSREPRLRVGQPRKLFDFPFAGNINLYTPSFDIHPDGTRFLVTDSVAENVSATEIMVVLNWKQELDRIFESK